VALNPEIKAIKAATPKRVVGRLKISGTLFNTLK